MVILSTESLSIATSVENWAVRNVSSSRGPIQFNRIGQKKSKTRSSLGNKVVATSASFAIRSFFIVMPCMSWWASCRFVTYIKRAWRKSSKKKNIPMTRLCQIYPRWNKRDDYKVFKMQRRKRTKWRSLRNANLLWQQPRMKKNTSCKSWKISILNNVSWKKKQQSSKRRSWH